MSKLKLLPSSISKSSLKTKILIADNLSENIVSNELNLSCQI